MRWELQPNELEVAQELHRRRILQSETVAPPDFRQATAEVAFLATYGRTVGVADLRVARRVLMEPQDLDGNTICVVERRSWPMRVWKNQLTINSFVFASVTSTSTVEFHGWLPNAIVERFPVWFYERDGKQISYAHEVERSFLFDMPEEFRFTDVCEHAQWPAWWEYHPGGWRCFGCSRLLADHAAAERIKRQDAEAGHRN